MENEKGLWFVIKNFPAFVREGLSLVTDAPSLPELRLDPDSERKREERRRHNEEWAERKRASGIDDSIRPDMIRKLPLLKTIHLQWLDTNYDPVWRDTDLSIDLDGPRIYFGSVGNQLLGGGHKGSGAIGVVIFAAPALIVLSPYIAATIARWKSRERKEGMSRHAIVLMERLKGQLDPETEALLRASLQNDWKRDCKMSRTVSFDEACALLDACALTERRMEPVEGDTLREELLQEFIWRDADGDMVGHIQFVGAHVHFARILGSEFEGGEAEALTLCARTRKVIDEDDE